MNNTFGWRYRLSGDEWSVSWAGADVERELEYGFSFGPFKSKDAAREYVRDISEKFGCVAT